MRRSSAAAAALLAVLFSVAHADAPTSMNFQGRLTDAAGNPLTGPQTVVFSIWDAVSAGNQLWSETQSVAVSSGIYNVGLGNVLALSTAVFAGGPTWLQLQIGADAAMTPRIPFRTSAYSYWAQMASGLLTKAPLNDLFNMSQVNLNLTGSPGYTVPAGKNFIAYNVEQQKSCVINPLTDCVTYPGPPAVTYCDYTACYIKVTGAHTATNLVKLSHGQAPFIIGPGDVITSTASNISIAVQGVLVSNRVTVVLQDVAPGGTYTNSSSSDLYFGLFPPSKSCPGSVNVGGFIWPGPGAGGQLAAGQAVTNNTSCTLTLDGYLK